jgi:hypothetical protein
LVSENVRERLAVNKQAAQMVDMQRFNLKKLNEGEVKELYQVTITNKFAALKNLEENGDISRPWDTIRENIKISARGRLGYYEFNHQKPWFDEERSELVD